MASKEISIFSQDILDKLTNPAYTGNEAQSSNSKFPPVINILQSDKQYEAFGEEGNEITKKMYGKLFIRKQTGNTLSDLVDSVSGTVIKIEQGFEAKEDVKDDAGNVKTKIVDSGTGTMRADDKESYMDQYPGRKITNMVKVILCPSDNIEEIKKSIESGVTPFCVLTIKGSGWGSWFDAQKDMDRLALSSKLYGNKPARSLMVSCFRFEVTSKMEKSDDGTQSWYVPVIKVSLNNPDVAYAFSDFVMESKKFGLFDRVAQKIEPISDKQLDAIGSGVDYEKELASDFGAKKEEEGEDMFA